MNLANRESWLPHAKVILLCLGGAVGYGIVHDQITARLCIEYFTVAHPPLPFLHTDSPTLVGLAWGVAATWSVGLALGIPLALASQSASNRPPLPIAQVRRNIVILLTVMAIAALLSGVTGFELSRRGVISMPDGWADYIPRSHHNGFMAAWFAHCASYLFGIVGGIFLIFTTWNQRGRPAIIQILPQSRLAVLRTILVVVAAGLIYWFRFFRH